MLLEKRDIGSLRLVAEQYVARSSSSPVVPTIASSLPHRARHAHRPAGIISSVVRQSTWPNSFMQYAQGHKHFKAALIIIIIIIISKTAMKKTEIFRIFRPQRLFLSPLF